VAVVVISVDAVERIIAKQISGIVEGALGLLPIKSEVVVVASWWNVVLLVVVSVIGSTFGSGCHCGALVVEKDVDWGWHCC